MIPIFFPQGGNRLALPTWISKGISVDKLPFHAPHNTGYNGVVDSLVAWWRFNNTLLDGRPQKNNLTKQAGTTSYASGIIGTALSFDGSTYFTAANETNFDFEINQPQTVSMWVYLPSSITSSVIVAKQANNNNTTPGTNIIILNTLKPTFRIGDGATTHTVNSNTALTTLGWSYLACTYSGNSNRSGMKIWINGTLDTTGTAEAMSGSMLNDVPVTIGARNDGATKASNGILIDDVRIYNRELSANEVMVNYKLKFIKVN